MGFFFKAIGKRIKLMVMESIYILTEQGMKDIGRMTCRMVTERRLGPMAQNTRVITNRERRRAKVLDKKVKSKTRI